MAALNNQTSVSNQNGVRRQDRALQLNLLIPPSSPQIVQFVSTFHSLVNAPSFDLPLLEKIRRYPLHLVLIMRYRLSLVQKLEQYFVLSHPHKDQVNQSLVLAIKAYLTPLQATLPKRFFLFLADHSNKFALFLTVLTLH